MTSGDTIGVLAWFGVMTLLGGWVGFAIMAGFFLFACVITWERWN
jgi:hypothetical protein